MKKLSGYGFDDELMTLWSQGGYAPLIPARVIADYGSNLTVATPELYTAELAGKLAHTAKLYDLPKAGDWVAIEPSGGNLATIHAVLPRRSEISRKIAGGKVTKQVLAANVDIAFIVQALDDDFSRPRLERYIYQLRQSNIEPIFIFNKADKSEDPAAREAEVNSLGIRLIITSTVTGQGIGEVAEAIAPGRTAVFLGSSGVGKSTLTNKLLGYDKQKTAEIRERDSTGRHTTSHRELFILPNGGLIIDTPGIRELQLWGNEQDLEESFPEIAKLTLQCKFRLTCGHTNEQGCAVQKAIKKRLLQPERLESFNKMKAELKLLESQTQYTPEPNNRQQNVQKTEKLINKHRHRYDYDED